MENRKINKINNNQIELEAYKNVKGKIKSLTI